MSFFRIQDSRRVVQNEWLRLQNATVTGVMQKNIMDSGIWLQDNADIWLQLMTYEERLGRECLENEQDKGSAEGCS